MLKVRDIRKLMIAYNHYKFVYAASNILLKMQCNCSKPLMCACPQKYFVKLGDFDSSTTVPGYGLKIEPHQMIRYASVLPLGTMGYRAPEVIMPLNISDVLLACNYMYSPICYIYIHSFAQKSVNCFWSGNC